MKKLSILIQTDNTDRKFWAREKLADSYSKKYAIAHATRYDGEPVGDLSKVDVTFN